MSRETGKAIGKSHAPNCRFLWTSIHDNSFVEKTTFYWRHKAAAAAAQLFRPNITATPAQAAAATALTTRTT